MDTTSALASGPRSLLRQRDYLAWLLADTSWQFGSSIRSFAMTLIAYAVTGSYAQAGVVATATMVAGVVTILPGGVLVDRIDRRTALVVSGLLRAVVYTVAALAWWAQVLTLPVLIGVGVASGIVAGLFGAASNAALKSVVDRPDLPRAIAANQGRDAAVSLSAPPLSGLLMGISYALPFVAAAVGALVQVLTTRLIRADLRPDAHAAAPRGTGWTERDRAAGRTADDTETDCGRATGTDAVSGNDAGTHRLGRVAGSVRRNLGDMFSGFSIFARSALLRHLVPAIVSINMGFGALYTGLTLILQGQGVDPWRIGLIDSALAAGMLVGALVAPRLIERVPTGRLTLVLFLLAAAIMVPVAVTRTQVVVLVCFAAVGLLLPALNGGIMGYTQGMIPSSEQGRTMAAISMANESGVAVTPALVGFGLQWFGAGPTMLATIVVFLLAAAFIVTNGELRALPTPDRWDLPDEVHPTEATPDVQGVPTPVDSPTPDGARTGEDARAPRDAMAPDNTSTPGSEEFTVPGTGASRPADRLEQPSVTTR